MKLAALVFSLLAGAFVTGAASAQMRLDPRDPYQLPDAPAPPSIADLTHRASIATLDTTFARVVSPTGVASAAELTRVELETDVRNRRLYVGVGEEIARATGPLSKSAATVAGYPEAWVRGVLATRAGLAYGGGIAFVVPAFQRDQASDAADAARTIRAVRPWAYSLFADNTFTARPFLDARVIDGNVTFQLREGLELQGLVANATLPTRSLVSRTTVYLGYQPVRTVGIGLELWEVYFVSATEVCLTRSSPCQSLTDDLRAAFAMSPSVRVLLGNFQPAISAIVPFEKPLFGEVRSFVAARLTLSYVFDGQGPLL